MDCCRSNLRNFPFYDFKTLSFSTPCAFSCLDCSTFVWLVSLLNSWHFVCLPSLFSFLFFFSLAKKLSSKEKGSNVWKWTAEPLPCSLLIYMFLKVLWVFKKANLEMLLRPVFGTNIVFEGSVCSDLTPRKCGSYDSSHTCLRSLEGSTNW